MITRYSDCHFAEIMTTEVQAKHIGSRPEPVHQCSWCGKACKSIELPLSMDNQTELMIRRWKDGDCTTSDLFTCISSNLARSYYIAFYAAQKTLQTTPAKYTWDMKTGQWVQGNDMAKNSPKATDE